jgi:hypothetical protein
MSLMLVVTCLTYLFTSFLSLLMATCLLSCYGLFMRIHSCFVSLRMLMVLKYLLVCLVKYPNFDLMHSISFFSWFVFDEFIAKLGEYGHKVGQTLY